VYPSRIEVLPLLPLGLTSFDHYLTTTFDRCLTLDPLHLRALDSDPLRCGTRNGWPFSPFKLNTTFDYILPRFDCFFFYLTTTCSRQVLAKGLEKRIEARYSSVDEMATDLYGCLVLARCLTTF
jgi:hypothetical protein